MVLDGLSGLYGLKYDSATTCGLPLYLCSYKLDDSATMVSQYIAVPLNTNVKYWACRWFYIMQVESYVRCDIDQVPLSNPKWSERPNSNGMEQVRELLKLINRKRLDGVVVVMNFTFWWI